jgi:hypothetical protein
VTTLASFYRDGTPERLAWADGRATCPECQREGCRGQCGCPCRGCASTHVTAWTPSACDILREIDERRSPEGREAQRRQYADEVLKAGGPVTLGECASHVAKCGVPPLVVGHARRADVKREAIVGVRVWLDTEPNARKACCVVSGLTGTGKSVAAAFACLKYAERRRWWQGQPSGPQQPVLVWLAGTTVTGLSLVMSDMEAVLANAERAVLLVIDELEVTGGRAGLQAMASLIGRRLDAGRLTLITTNANPAAITEGLGQHIADRLMASHVVAVKAQKSMRSRAA